MAEQLRDEERTSTLKGVNGVVEDVGSVDVRGSEVGLKGLDVFCMGQGSKQCEPIDLCISLLACVPVFEAVDAKLWARLATQSATLVAAPQL